jgi:hypothetical protein
MISTGPSWRRRVAADLVALGLLAAYLALPTLVEGRASTLREGGQ